MRFVNSGNADNQVVLSVWASGQGKMPAQAQKAPVVFETTLNGEVVKVYENYSKTSVRYQYTQVGGVWMWTRDAVQPGDYVTFVKPVKVKAAVEAPVQEIPAGLESSAAQAMGLEKPKVKVIKKGAK
jgi:hypothetical protein